MEKFIKAFFIVLMSTGIFLSASQAEELSDFRAATLALINQERAKEGLPAFARSPEAEQVAQEWAEHLTGEHRLVHRTGDDLLVQVKKYNWHGISENLHRANFPQTPQLVVTAWMNSPPHRRNLLRPTTTAAGIGLALGNDGFTYVVFNGVTL